MKKKMLCNLFLVLLLCFSFVVLQQVKTLNAVEGNFLTSFEDVQQANKNHIFGRFVTSKLKQKEVSVDGLKEQKGEVIFKLFGVIPIKKVSVQMVCDDDFYVGGVPIGLDIVTDGAVVVDRDENCLSTNLREGDIITKIDGKDVGTLEEICEALPKDEKVVEIEVLRKNKPVKEMVKTYRDDKNQVKIGFWVKDDVEGVGTLTFVNKKTKQYGALGHPLVENLGQNVIPVHSGRVFECNLIGIEKGRRNEPGQLKCSFVTSRGSKGSIETNENFGIKGRLSSFENLVDENKVTKVAGRLAIKPGKAKLVSTISGIREEYDIEIIKTNYQKTEKDKSFVFRVKDKRLIGLSGGIVQGMSGSPILQNGKIVGAVTHVFTSDPTKGYGVYIDWML